MKHGQALKKKVDSKWTGIRLKKKKKTTNVKDSPDLNIPTVLLVNFEPELKKNIRVAPLPPPPIVKSVNTPAVFTRRKRKTST
jgi:hypothetical protein